MKHPNKTFLEIPAKLMYVNDVNIAFMILLIEIFWFSLLSHLDEEEFLQKLKDELSENPDQATVPAVLRYSFDAGTEVVHQDIEGCWELLRRLDF